MLISCVHTSALMPWRHEKGVKGTVSASSLKETPTQLVFACCLPFVLFSVEMITLLCMIYDIWWDPGSREANPWLVVVHNVFFCSTMLLLHWQCVWNQCNSEKWSWCISDAFQMVLHSWPMLFCVYNSIVNKIQKTTAWNAAPHLCWVFAGFVLILVSIFRYCSSAVDRF